jgi:hypothetical protein
MGAWGHGSFDNDDAADWVYAFEKDGRAAVAQALRNAADLSNEEYLEAPEASAAVAAAELVAAARDGDLSKLSEAARNAFVSHSRYLADEDLVELARRAVERIQRQSELKELWEESENSDDWAREMDHLATRLR